MKDVGSLILNIIILLKFYLESKQCPCKVAEALAINFTRNCGV